MKEKLTNNWGLKLLAAVSAVLLWLLIMNNNDPVTTFTVTGIPIEVLHEQEAITDYDMVYKIVGNSTASVSVTTRTRDKEKITPADFRATVDLNDIYSNTSRVAIRVELVGDAGLVRSWQQITYMIQVSTEKVITKTLSIEVEKQGEVEDSYVYKECTLSSDTVTLRAPESQIARVASVKAIVDVSQSSADEQQTVELTFYDAAGREVSLETLTSAEVDRTTVDVNVVVQKTSPVSVDVIVNNKDRVAEGYRYINYRISQPYVSVIGTRQAVAGLDKIQIEVDAEGASGDVIREVDIMDYLPDNVSVAGDNTMVTIRLVVEPEGSIDLEVPTSEVTYNGRNSNVRYMIEEESVKVNVFGLESDWEGITADDIQLIAEVEGLGIGEHTIRLTAAEIEGLVISIQDDVTVIVSPPLVTPDEDETDGETGSETGGAANNTTADSTDGAADNTTAGSTGGAVGGQTAGTGSGSGSGTGSGQNSSRAESGEGNTRH